MVACGGINVIKSVHFEKYQRAVYAPYGAREHSIPTKRQGSAVSIASYSRGA